MKTKCIFIIFCVVSFLLFSAFFSACTNNIINRTSDFEQVDIFIGDSTRIDWNFDNADSVIVNGFDRVFSARDSLLVVPSVTTVYYITAYNSYGDKQSKKYKVNVNGVPKTGPELSDLISLEESKQLSNYLTGITNTNINNISKLKIVGCSYPYGGNKFSLKFLPLDKYGNYIENFSVSSGNLKLLAKSSTVKPNIINYNENIEIDNSKLINFYFCIDNSAAAEENNNIYQKILSYSKAFSPIDNYFISYFNQNLVKTELIQKEFNNNFTENFYLDISAATGFNSLNKSLGQVINFSQMNSGNSVIILITQSADNASILYDERDLLQHAKNNNIPIYVITIGTTVPTYNLTYLANGTGGAIYVIVPQELEILPQIIHEIVFSQRYYYHIDFLAAVGTSQKELSLELLLENSEDDLLISSSYNMPLKQDKIYSEYQVLAAYNTNEDVVSPAYFNGLRDLVTVLNDNPSLLIELIGNSNNYEGNNEKEYIQKALTRSQNLRRKLVEFGANPAQIRVRSEGAMLPIYPMPEKKWQKYYNTRTEIRWLLPESLPYEIIAGTVKTETEAQIEVEQLEHYGYQAYYQRIILDGRAGYRIIVWGYATEELAVQAKKKLSKEFKKKFELK